ncbi:unannotated protein [freshwater metagenome]|uniref:Unannotated protein n=1 Tax=freshwater metagenome TaxID=449393 RepID=A0A6J7BW95_9ZZZZ
MKVRTTNEPVVILAVWLDEPLKETKPVDPSVRAAVYVPGRLRTKVAHPSGPVVSLKFPDGPLAVTMRPALGVPALLTTFTAR